MTNAEQPSRINIPRRPALKGLVDVPRLPGESAGLDALSNTSHDNFWQVLPDMAGARYRRRARSNHRHLAGLALALHEDGEFQIGERQYAGAEAAEEWYRKLGAQNSLYGAREDLMLAARVLCTPEGAEHTLTVQELMKKLDGDDDSVSDSHKLLAVQMLFDATRDPSPSRDPHVNIEATNQIYYETMGKVTAKIFERSVAATEAKVAADEKLTDEDQERVSTALKFNFESRFAVLENMSDDEVEQQLTEVLQEKIKAAERRQSRGDTELSHHERIYEAVNTVGDMRRHLYAAEAWQQAGELIRVEGYISNGSLTELYTGLLLRYMSVSSGNLEMGISAATARQDRPHDKIFGRGFTLGRLSHDIVLKNYRPNETRFLQVKVGEGSSGDSYHEDSDWMDPYRGESEEPIKVPRKARREGRAGITQLRGAFAVMAGRKLHAGDSGVFERHLGNVKRQLDAKYKKSAVVEA